MPPFSNRVLSSHRVPGRVIRPVISKETQVWGDRPRVISDPEQCQGRGQHPGRCDKELLDGGSCLSEEVTFIGKPG